MKKAIMCVVCILAMVYLVSIGVEAYSTVRFEYGTVIKYDATENVTYVTGATGNVWGYYGQDTVGKEVVLKIDDKGTAEYEDDEVMGVFLRVR